MTLYCVYVHTCMFTLSLIIVWFLCALDDVFMPKDDLANVSIFYLRYVIAYPLRVDHLYMGKSILL